MVLDHCQFIRRDPRRFEDVTGRMKLTLHPHGSFPLEFHSPYLLQVHQTADPAHGVGLPIRPDVRRRHLVKLSATPRTCARQEFTYPLYSWEIRETGGVGMVEWIRQGTEKLRFALLDAFYGAGRNFVNIGE